MEYGRAYNYGDTIEHHVIPVVVVCGYAESEAIITKMWRAFKMRFFRPSISNSSPPEMVLGMELKKLTGKFFN